LAFAGRGKERQLSLGNVFDGFTETKNRLTLLNHTERVRPKCKECPLAKRCNGGCYAANLTDTGSIFTPSDTYCKLIFAQMEATDYAKRRLKELGRKNIDWHTGDRNADTSDAS
jgi:radical SAM protein with 4Fe4S-binding SPASM domain